MALLISIACVDPIPCAKNPGPAPFPRDGFLRFFFRETGPVWEPEANLHGVPLMTRDSDRTVTVPPVPDPPTGSLNPRLDAGLAAAFGPETTPGGWSQPPLLRDEPSDLAPLVQPTSPDMPRGGCKPYQLLGEIARGGMGVILKGRDPDLGRDLAIKVLKPELAGRPTAEQRFVEEAQVCGQLQHPGVVPVHGLGRLPDGRPYFVMKLVKGRTLAARLTDRSNPEASRVAFLQIYLQVCRTIAYAHSKGVIHRDLKPANIMVGSFDEVQVMDWGLAKVLPHGGVADEDRANREHQRPEHDPTVIQTARSGSGSGSSTEAGSVMGTPAFMPPEQAGGEIDKLDERADVFGLGAILCVILTGQPPYVSETAEAVRLMAVRGQLADAFARLDASGADPELVALAKRCMAPERTERPRNADAVAAAVARYLAGVEDRVHRAEIERAAAQARTIEERKRRRVQLALAACLLLLVALGGLGAWWRERAETEQARVEGERQVEQAKADAAAERARAGVGAAIALSQDLRTKYRFREAKATLNQAAGLIPADAPVDLRDALRNASDDLAFIRELDDIRMKRAIWIEVPGGINEFDTAGAPRAYRAAFSSRGLDIVDGNPGAVAARVRASAVKAELLAALDDWAAFEQTPAVRDRVLAVARLADPGPWQDRFRDPSGWADKTNIARLADEARPEALLPGTVIALAELMWQHDLDPGRVLLAAEPAHPGDFLIPFALGMFSKLNARDSATVMAHLRTARSICPDNVAVLNYLVVECWRAGDVDAARQWYREAVRVDPGFSRVHVNMGGALCDVKRDYDGAIACFREAIRLDPEDAKAHFNLGMAFRNKGDLDTAISSYREAVRLNPKMADAWHHLGLTLGLKEETDEAIDAFDAAIQLNPKRSLFHTNLGNALLKKKDVERAIAYHREAIRLDPKDATARYNLGVSLRTKGDRDGAIAAYREAARLDPTFTVAHFNLGVLLQQKGDADGAIAAFEATVRSDPKHAGGHSRLGALRCDVKRDYHGAAASFRTVVRLEPTDPHAHYNLGNALRGQGDLDGAIACYREAVRLDPEYFQAHSNLGLVLQFKGDLDAAIASYQTALRINPKDAIAQHRLNDAARLKAERDAKRELAPPPREVKP